jgi:WD40 repeat protein
MSDGAMQHILVEKDEWKGEPSVAYSPDSKQAAIYSSGDQKIGLFDLATGKLMDELENTGYQSLAYSLDGQILIAGTNENLELWDLATGNLLAEIPIPAKLEDWAISPDGRYIGTVSEDGTISLWGVQP